MDYILSKQPETNKNLIKNFTHEVYQAHFEKNYKKNFTIPYHLSDTQLEKLTKDFHPEPINYAPYKLSEHPYIATLHQYAYHVIYQSASKPILDIGSRVNQFAKRYSEGDHACTLIDNPKDEARLNHFHEQIKHLREKQNYHHAILHAIENRSPNSIICFDGTQNCTAQVNTIISIHSAYDIPISWWPHIMSVHGASKAYLAMHLPTMMLLQKSFVDPDNQYRVIKHGTRMLFGVPNDESIVYDHDYDNVEKYLKTTIINGEHFNILCEIINRRGPQVIIKMSRINTSGSITTIIDIPEAREFIRIPKMEELIYHHAKINKCNQVYLVRRDKLENSLKYAESLDDQSFQYRKIYNYMLSLSFRIMIANKAIQSYWDIGAAELGELASFVYVFTAVQRFKNGHNLDTCMKEINKEKYALESAWGRFCYWISGKWRNWTSRNIQTITNTNNQRKNRYEGFDFLTMNYETLNTFMYKNHSYRNDLVQFNIETYKDKKYAGSRKIDKISEYISCGTPFNSREYKTECDAFRRDCYFPRADNELEKHAMKAYNYICSQQDKCATLEFITGVPGAGKTTFILENLRSTDLIVVPTRQLKAEIKALNHNAKVLTPHRAIMECHKYRRVIVDEVFRHSVGYLATLAKCGAKTIIGIGDPHQIGFIDYGHHHHDVVKTASLLMKYPTVRRLNVSHRIPRDICEILKNKFDYPDIMTTNKSTSSIIIKYNLKCSNKRQNIVFTQNAKEYFASQGHDVITVDAAQGSTFKNGVNLLLTTDCSTLIQQAREQVVVAITRHSGEGKLVIRAEDGALIQQLRIDGTNIRENLINNGELFPTDYTVVSKPSLTQMAYHEGSPPVLYSSTDKNKVSEILDQVAPTAGNEHNLRDVEDLQLSEPITTMHIRMKNLNLKPVRMVGGRRYGVKPYTKLYSVTDRIATLRVMIERYASFIKRFPSEKKNEIAYKMYNRFTVQYLKNQEYRKIDTTMIWQSLRDFCDSIDDKEYSKRINDTVQMINAYDRSSTWKIDFFLKEIDKLKLVPEFSTSTKAGQGISAHQKTMNSFYCIVYRAVEMALKKSLNDSILFANGLNDEQIGQFWQCQKIPDNAVIDETDYSQFDAAQNEVTQQFERLIVESFGVPTHWLDYFYELRSSWTLIAPELASLEGEGKRHSGGADTLLMNTVVNMGLKSCMYYYDKIYAFMAKGDDGVTASEGFTLDQDFKTFLEKEMGLGVKAIYSEVPQFCGLMLCKYGAYPDLVRAAARVCSKLIVDETEFNEYTDAARMWLIQIRDHIDIRISAQLTAAYYNIKYDDAMYLYSYIHNFTTENYADFCRKNDEVDEFIRYIQEN